MIELCFDATRSGQMVEIQTTKNINQGNWQTFMQWNSEDAGLQQVEVDVTGSDAQFFRLLLIE